MAFAQIEINPAAWTLIGNNVSVFTFQCKTDFGMDLLITTTNTQPSLQYGLEYPSGIGELMIDPVKFSVSGGKYFWAKSKINSGYVVVDV